MSSQSTTQTIAAVVGTVVAVATYFGLSPDLFKGQKASDVSAEVHSTVKPAPADSLEIANIDINGHTKLEITGIRFYPEVSGALVKITADVNGLEYIFPKNENAGWIAPSAKIQGQYAHLKPAKSYFLKFEVWKIDGKSRQETKLFSNDRIRLSGKQQSGAYTVHGFDPASSDKSGALTASIEYTMSPLD